MKFTIKTAALLSAAVLAFAAPAPLYVAAEQSSVSDDVKEYVCSSDSEAAQIIRQSLKDHSEEFTIELPDNGEDQKEKGFQLVYDAFGETGSGTDGDYLRFSVHGFKCSLSKLDGKLVMKYSFTYYTTLEEEATLTKKLEEVMSENNFSSITGDYNKIRSIYHFNSTVFRGRGGRLCLHRLQRAYKKKRRMSGSHSAALPYIQRLRYSLPDNSWQDLRYNKQY